MATTTKQQQQDEATAKELELTLPLPDVVEASLSGKDESATKTTTSKRPYPKKVLFIVVEEFCERYSYYGLRTILVLYLINALNFSDHRATITYHLFCALCYTMPVMGAILGDSVFGKFKTILYLSIIYLFGELTLLGSSIFWYETERSTVVALTGLVLIGVGTGGIKPCVSGFGGDQFLAHENKWRDSFFSLFYVAVSSGSLLTMFITPVFRSHFQCVHRTDCYPYAFGLPCLLMLIGIIVFASARKHYYIAPLPERNVIVAFAQCIWLALSRKITGEKKGLKAVGRTVGEEEAQEMSRTKYGSFEKEPVAVSCCKKNTTSNNHWLYLSADKFDKESIEGFRAVLNILTLFIPLPIYWTLFDQQGSLWTLQAARMDGNLFNTGYVLEPDQILVLHPILLLISIPFFDLLVYPLAGQFNLLRSSISRITLGGLLLAVAFLGSALIEMRIQRFYPPAQPIAGHSVIQLVNGLFSGDGTLLNVSLLSDDKFQPLNYLHDNQVVDIKPSGVRLFNVPTQSVGYTLRFEMSTYNSTNLQISEHELHIAPLPENSVKLLYINEDLLSEQKQTVRPLLSYKMLDDSLQLASSGKARVRLLYEIAGDSAEAMGVAMRRQFHLLRVSSSGLLRANTDDTTFNMSRIEYNYGSNVSTTPLLISSEYLPVTVPAQGDLFVLRTEDGALDSVDYHEPIRLEPGTRSLIVVRELSGSAEEPERSVKISFELLQDNKYRITMLYQFVPYLLHSMSDMVFSISGLQFTYSMAPNNMKSVTLAFWYLNTALGNLLTVLIESLKLSANMANNFLFYAAILTLDMLLFALIGQLFHKQQQQQQRITN